MLDEVVKFDVAVRGCLQGWLARNREAGKQEQLTHIFYKLHKSSLTWSVKTYRLQSPDLPVPRFRRCTWTSYREPLWADREPCLSALTPQVWYKSPQLQAMDRACMCLPDKLLARGVRDPEFQTSNVLARQILPDIVNSCYRTLSSPDDSTMLPKLLRLFAREWWAIEIAEPAQVTPRKSQAHESDPGGRMLISLDTVKMSTTDVRSSGILATTGTCGLDWWRISSREAVTLVVASRPSSIWRCSGVWMTLARVGWHHPGKSWTDMAALWTWKTSPRTSLALFGVPFRSSRDASLGNQLFSLAGTGCGSKYFHTAPKVESQQKRRIRAGKAYLSERGNRIAETSSYCGH